MTLRNKIYALLFFLIFAGVIFYFFIQLTAISKKIATVENEIISIKKQIQDLDFEAEKEAKEKDKASYIPLGYKTVIEKWIQEGASKFITQEHLSGGTWVITYHEFLTPELILIEYEDGHTVGQTIIKIDQVDGRKVKAHLFWKGEY